MDELRARTRMADGQREDRHHRHERDLLSESGRMRGSVLRDVNRPGGPNRGIGILASAFHPRLVATFPVVDCPRRGKGGGHPGALKGGNQNVRDEFKQQVHQVGLSNPIRAPGQRESSKIGFARTISG